MNDRYVIDVGGCYFFSSRTTLYRSPLLKSMIEAYDSESDTPIESRPPLFVDRDSFFFQYVLNYMRSYKLCAYKDPVLLDQLSLEASFFRLTDLKTLIEKLILDHSAKKEAD